MFNKTYDKRVPGYPPESTGLVLGSDLEVICEPYYKDKDRIASSDVSKFAKQLLVRSGIRTHAWRTRLRPERSALDRSAILTPHYYDDSQRQMIYILLLSALLLMVLRYATW